jgi:hypothetical protein
MTRPAEPNTSASASSAPSGGPLDAGTLDHLIAELEGMEELQKGKVIDLARRILPNLTAEDIRNPHDFPDLTDPDWHFEDGQLTGVQSVLFLVRTLRRGLDR